MKMCYIYKTTNMINNKFYIGQSINLSSSYLGSGKILKLAILKYGKKKFKKEIIEVCTESELNDREIYWIKKLKPYYNIDGGGYNRAKETGDAISKANKGNIPWNKGLKNAQISTRKGIKQPQMRGKNHPMWRGGTTLKRERAKGRIEYKKWRTSVFKRDGYKCVLCGCNKSGELQADHIRPWCLFPKLRYKISNGRTLCKSCHRKTDTYGHKARLWNQ